MVRNCKTEEPIWAKYITEDNLPTKDLKYPCSIIGLGAAKKLMFNAAGQKFSIHAHCNQKYKKQYIIDNFDGSRRSMLDTIRARKTTRRFVYKVLEERAKGNKNRGSTWFLKKFR